MTRRGVRTLQIVTSEVEKSEDEIDEGLASTGRRRRMRKMPLTLDTEEQREDTLLKKLGLFEDGMSQEQKRELLLVVAASEQSATLEEKSRQISNTLDGNSDVDPELLSFSKTDAEPSKPKPLIDVDDAKPSSSMSPILFNNSFNSSPKVVAESPDIFENGSRSPQRQDEMENLATLKETESLNGEVPSTSIPFLDSVKRKYDRKFIDPFHFNEDVQEAKLIDKRKHVIKDESYWSCCCPDGIRPRDFAKSLRQKFEVYHKDLYALQRRSLTFLEWGVPVAVGRHCSDTLDVWGSRRNVKLLDDPEVVRKEEIEAKGSSSPDEFENLTKKDDFSKRKFNFKSKSLTYSRYRQEKLAESKKSVYSYICSSEEDEPPKKDIRTSNFQDLFTKEKTKSSSEDSAENETDEYVPGRQSAKKKKKSLRVGLAKPKPSPRAHGSDGLGEKSFYGKSANQSSFTMHHATSEDACQQSATPRRSTNLQDVLKPNLRINVNKVGLGRKWLHKDDSTEQPLASNDVADGSSEDLEIVDTFSKRKPNVGGDGEFRQRGRATRKLANLARCDNSFVNSDSVEMEGNASKRMRLANTLADENEELVELDVAKRPPSTSRQMSSLDSFDSSVRDSQAQKDDVQCPLCCKKFAQSAIEEHASDCQGEQEEARWIPTRTPKNKHRCYICRGVFDPATYNDHVIVCVARKRTMQMDFPEEEATTPKVRVAVAEKLQKENCEQSLLSRLNTPKIGAVCSAKTFNCISVESPVGNTRSLHPISIPLNHIDEGDFSMAHVSTPTFQMFKPISQLKDSLVDFKNQFPVANQAKKRRTTKSVKTKKRKRSSKVRKSPRGRKSSSK